MYKLITAPAAEPVSLTDMKLHLRVSISTDDDLITALITTARRDVETMSRHALINQTWDYFTDGFPGGNEIELAYPPLVSVTGVYYTPDGGSEQTWAAANYIVDTNSLPGRIYLQTTTGGGVGAWPGDALVAINGVRIRFVAGFGAAAANVDERLVLATKLLAAHYYEHREAVTSEKELVLLPMGVSSLIWEFRAKAYRF